MINAYLREVQYYVPQASRTNDDLVAQNPDWDAHKIFAKTGIRSRPISAPAQTASDLAFEAGQKVLATADVDAASIDALLLCTQSPDYFLPTSACLLQQRLGLPTSCAAFDFNLGCSGFTYGLWLARALILSQSATNVLLLVADTYTKYCDPHDLTTATIFGDGAGAALITGNPDRSIAQIGPSIVGTDGRGAENLIVRSGCARRPLSVPPAHHPGSGPAAWTDNASLSPPNRTSLQTIETLERPRLEMNGPEIFSFTLSQVQSAIAQLLAKVGWNWDQVDLFLLHQANRFMLEQLRTKMQLPEAKLPIDVADLGNTVSATIPILLRRLLDNGRLRGDQNCVLAGFGVGYSWAVTALTCIHPGH